MKCGRPLAIIVHYTVQFNLECCKSSVPDKGPNTILVNLVDHLLYFFSATLCLVNINMTSLDTCIMYKIKIIIQNIINKK